MRKNKHLEIVLPDSMDSKILFNGNYKRDSLGRADRSRKYDGLWSAYSIAAMLNPDMIEILAELPRIASNEAFEPILSFKPNNCKYKLQKPIKILWK